MKRVAIAFAVAVILAFLTEAASAQFLYRRTVVAPPPPVVVHRGPAVVYQPTTVVYSRRRPILGGYSVRTRPAYRRTVVW